MTFVEKYSAPDYIVSDDNRKLIVLADKGEQRDYMGIIPKPCSKFRKVLKI